MTDTTVNNSNTGITPEIEAAVTEALGADIKISVIVPIYNACKHLRPALDSILAQTLREIEIICVDDGSTDTSLDMLKIYQKMDNRIRIVTETNAGPGHARNNGLKRARGKYVAFLDADDFFEPEMLEKLYDHAEENDLDIAIARYDIYDNKKGKFVANIESEHGKIFEGGSVTSKNEYPDYILQSTTGAAWNKLFKKSFISEKSITFTTEAMIFEDVYFTVSALAFAERVARIPDILVHHRIYSQQSRVRSFRKYYIQVPGVFLKIKEFLMKGGMYQPLERGFVNLTTSRCLHVYKLLWSDARADFWDMLHNGYAEKLGWFDRSEDFFEKSEVCEFCANVQLYTFKQYSKRCQRGLKLKLTNIKQKLQSSKRWKKVGEFFKKLLGFFKKNDQA